MGQISELLEQMQNEGLAFERGSPASDQEIAALQASAGNRFPADYLAFLKEFGWLRTGTRVVFGTGPDGVEIGAAAVDVEMEFSNWNQPVVDVTPLTGPSNGFPQECLVVDAEGRLQSFRRGQLEPRKRTFEEYVAQELAEELQDHVTKVRAAAFHAQMMAAIQDRIPGELLVGESPNGGLLVQRPGEGSDIEIRFRPGQGYRPTMPGIFVQWTEPASKSPEAMNDFNRRALFVRGCTQAGFDDRYRGCLPADLSSVDTLLNALAHDAGLPIAVDVGAGEPSLDEIAAALPPSPVSPEMSLFLAVTGQDPKPPVFEREGDLLLLSTEGMKNDKVKYTIRIRSVGHGLVDVSHVLAEPLTWQQINTVNGASTNPGGHRFDQERMTRAVQDGETSTLFFKTTLPGIINGAYVEELADLLRCADEFRVPIPEEDAGTEFA